MTERYKELKEYPGYRIYDNGDIFSIKSNRFIKSFDDNHGYKQVTLYIGSTKKERVTVKVHILVAKAFIDNPYDYKEINHIDKNKSNNNANNLEWCSREYNMQYSSQEHMIAAQSNISPMTEEMVKFIPILIQYRCSIKLIASLYKVGHITIRNVVKGRTWKNLNLTFPQKTYYNKGMYNRGIIMLPKYIINKLLSFNVDNTVLNSRIKELESV